MPCSSLRVAPLLMLLVCTACGGATPTLRPAMANWTPGCNELAMTWQDWGDHAEQVHDTNWVAAPGGPFQVRTDRLPPDHREIAESTCRIINPSDGSVREFALGEGRFNFGYANATTAFLPILRPSPDQQLVMLEVDLDSRETSEIVLTHVPWAGSDTRVREMVPMPDGLLVLLVDAFIRGSANKGRRGFFVRYLPESHRFIGSPVETAAWGSTCYLPVSSSEVLAFDQQTELPIRLNVDTGLELSVDGFDYPGDYTVRETDGAHFFGANPFPALLEQQNMGRYDGLQRITIWTESRAPLNVNSRRLAQLQGSLDPQAALLLAKDAARSKTMNPQELGIARLREFRTVDTYLYYWDAGKFSDPSLPQDVTDADDSSAPQLLGSSLHIYTIDGDRAMLGQTVFPTPPGINSGKGVVRFGVIEVPYTGIQWLGWIPLPDGFAQACVQPKLYVFPFGNDFQIGMTGNGEKFDPNLGMMPTHSWSTSFPIPAGLTRADFPWPDGTSLSRYG